MKHILHIDSLVLDNLHKISSLILLLKGAKIPMLQI